MRTSARICEFPKVKHTLVEYITILLPIGVGSGLLTEKVRLRLSLEGETYNNHWDD
jgi:hypothetical protein